MGTTGNINRAIKSHQALTAMKTVSCGFLLLSVGTFVQSDQSHLEVPVLLAGRSEIYLNWSQWVSER